jgi:hypothetical protein
VNTTSIATPKAALSRELQEFLLDLALTVQRNAMYPGGHPSVDAALAAVLTRVDRLLRSREVLSLGVARRQIIVEGFATDSAHPVLRSLAERLHRHRLGAVSLRRGITEQELRDVLGAVAADADRSGEALGTWPAERLAQWPHVGLYRVSYEQLNLIAGGHGEESLAGAALATQLWIGLAQAAMARGENVPLDGDPQPEEVARAINEQPAAAAYDQMLVGYMLQLTDELKQSGDGGVVQRRLSRLIRQLDPATLRRLLDMGGDVAQRSRFLHNASEALTPDAVLELVRAAAQTQGENISTSMLRLLTKLSAVADDPGPASVRAEAQMRDQVRELLHGWALDDPNPGAYTQALDALSRTNVGEEDDAGSPDAPEPLRLVQMGLEIGASGVPFWRAVGALLETGQLPELFALLDGMAPGDPQVEAIWRRLESADYVRRVLTTDPVDFDSLDRILQRLPPATVTSLLLDRISESTSRATRMGVFKRIGTRGYSAVPFVLERLVDTRWFVQRNMLALLNELGASPPDFSALAYARHAQVSVRREALQIAMRIPAEREQAITLALLDVDERAIRVGVLAAREHGVPGQALSAVLKRLDEPDLSPELRSALIRLMARYPVAPVVERLLGFVVQERRLLKPKLLPRTPEQLAALSALARMKTTDSRVRAALKLAASAGDPEIRTAAGARP